MGNDLTKLYNTLMLIETKGENTKLMAQCLNFTLQLISQANAQEQAKSEEGDS